MESPVRFSVKSFFHSPKQNERTNGNNGSLYISRYVQSRPRLIHTQGKTRVRTPFFALNKPAIVKMKQYRDAFLIHEL